MLNEYKEYELLLTEGYGGLLRRDNVKNKLAGLRPVLTVLARGFLERLEQNGITDIAEKSAACDEFLKCWLKGEYTIKPYFNKAVCDEFERAKKACLLEFIVSEKMNIRGLGASDKVTVAEYIDSKISSYSKSMFYSYKENSVNEIYFKAIIADALYKGKLKNQKLVLKDEGPLYGIFCSTLGAEQIKTLLAVVAICLQHLPRGQYSSNAKLAELSNYINKPTSQKNKRASALSSVAGFVEEGMFSFNGAPIISKTELTGGVVKLKLNRSWLEAFDVRLMDKNEEINNGYIAFLDHDLFPDRF